MVEVCLVAFDAQNGTVCNAAAVTTICLRRIFKEP
jgi:hypothetical protein